MRRRRRLYLIVGVIVALLGVVGAVLALIHPAIGIAIAAIGAGGTIWVLVLQHRESDFIIEAVPGRDDSVLVSRGGGVLRMRPAKPTDPKPTRAGKKQVVGACRAYLLSDGRWEIRVKGRKGIQGWVQEGAGEEAATAWYVKHVRDEWVGKYPTLEAACARLAQPD